MRYGIKHWFMARALRIVVPGADVAMYMGMGGTSRLRVLIDHPPEFQAPAPSLRFA